MKYLLSLLHVIVLCFYRKEHEGDWHGGLMCGPLAVGSDGGQKEMHSRALYELMRRKRRGGARRGRNRRRNKRLAKQRRARRREAKREQRSRRKQRKRAERKRKRKERKKRRQERREKKRQKKRQKKEEKKRLKREEKERLKEGEAGGPGDDLQINSNHYGEHAVEGQAGPPPAGESYTDGAEEGASSAVGRGATQMGSLPPERSGGPIDPYGSYGSSPHGDRADDSADNSAHDSADDSGYAPHGGGSATGGGASPYEAELEKNVKVIHFDRLKREPKGRLISKIRGILNTLE
ncbi:conserved Plasmodium protein, unknown function [Plasmodium vivax]|uniref:Uncharacterized protein n=1 Tax=Plasmodium vivax (strain Brazil I) TaxID=1033975 RepID=A0A0J9T1F0_PLAV1|nr:hypothetical protein PVBG_03585 [Plasmodium vivax Brazil I]CAI7717928.1 conserved Plasmodium protein, unknown function [Plasmodium vivax]